jgi:hypothetical protein
VPSVLYKRTAEVPNVLFEANSTGKWRRDQAAAPPGRTVRVSRPAGTAGEDC